jgi:hypothetical protein
VLQPCSEVVVTLSVMDTSRRLTVVQQEIQVGDGCHIRVLHRWGGEDGRVVCVGGCVCSPL